MKQTSDENKWKYQLGIITVDPIPQILQINNIGII